MTLRFLTRQRCPLCDSAGERVRRWAPRLGHDVTEIDVDAHPELAERFGGRVPVLLAGDRVVAEGRMSGSQLVAGLLRLRMSDRSGRDRGVPPRN